MPEPSHSAIRFGHEINTAFARRGLARFVFQVRSAGPTQPGRPVSAIVALGDSLTRRLPPLGGIGDSTGLTVVDVPRDYSYAAIRRIGYAHYTVPLVVRPGYTDTITVDLAEARVCLSH